MLLQRATPGHVGPHRWRAGGLLYPATAPPSVYTLSLHDALPISLYRIRRRAPFDRPVSPMLCANLRHSVGNVLADDFETATYLARDRVHANDRTERDQCRDQSVFNEVLTGFIPVQIRNYASDFYD